MISIAIPVYRGMENADFFLKRCLDSIERQTYKNYEIVMHDQGVVGDNLNEIVKRCKGEIIHILCMDDFYAHDNALKTIAEEFEGQWLITGCNNNPNPYYTEDVHTGNNKLGGLSVIVVKNEDVMPFDPSLRWLVDCDFYKRMYAKYGSPKILNGVNVMIGEGRHQATNMLAQEIKRAEVHELTKRYEN